MNWNTANQQGWMSQWIIHATEAFKSADYLSNNVSQKIINSTNLLKNDFIQEQKQPYLWVND